jgi:hypothetical protein
MTKMGFKTDRLLPAQMAGCVCSSKQFHSLQTAEILLVGVGLNHVRSPNRALAKSMSLHDKRNRDGVGYVAAIRKYRQRVGTSWRSRARNNSQSR